MHAKRVPSRVQVWCARGTLPRHDDPRFAPRGFLPGQCPATPSTRVEEGGEASSTARAACSAAA